MIAQRPTTLLNAAYGVFPIVAGADKFTNLLCRWDKYLSPLARKVLPMKGRTFMRVVGVVEIAVGAAMFVPGLRKFAAYAASGWLGCIALNLIANGDYDIAARDVWLAVGAASFALSLGQEKALTSGTADRASLEAAPSITSRPEVLVPEYRQ
ncbi:MAG: hypothetical protein ACJ790_19970 [Myxococcaceae bacterium]